MATSTTDPETRGIITTVSHPISMSIHPQKETSSIPITSAVSSSTTPSTRTNDSPDLTSFTPPTEFPKFPRLPAEIRVQIWEHTFWPRLVGIEAKYQLSPTGKITGTMLVSTSRAPAALYVNVESRFEALKVYTFMFGCGENPARVPFNLDKDILTYHGGPNHYPESKAWFHEKLRNPTLPEWKAFKAPEEAASLRLDPSSLKWTVGRWRTWFNMKSPVRYIERGEMNRIRRVALIEYFGEVSFYGSDFDDPEYAEQCCRWIRLGCHSTRRVTGERGKKPPSGFFGFPPRVGPPVPSGEDVGGD